MSGSAFPVCVMLCKERGAKAARSDRPFQPDPASRETLQSGVFRPRFLGKRAFTSLPKTPRTLLLSLYKRAALFPPAGGLRKPPPKAAESVLFLPARGLRKSFQKAAEASSFSPKRGGRDPPCFPRQEGLGSRLAFLKRRASKFSSLHLSSGLFLALSEGPFPRLPLPLVQKKDRGAASRPR